MRIIVAELEALQLDYKPCGSVKSLFAVLEALWLI